MPEIPLLIIIIVVVAVVFDYTNGAHDCAGAISAVVSTGALSPRLAVVMAATLNFVGALSGTKVALTIGDGIVKTQFIQGCQTLVLAALIGAIAWNVITWYFGLPSSSSHALIGGLIGAALAYKGWEAVNIYLILEKVIIPIFISPLAGFFFGYLVMLGLAWLTFKRKPGKTGKVFVKLQIIAAAFLAWSHGLNDAQKTMGVIALALFIMKQIDHVYIPLWVQIACALAMSLGTATGGWKIIKTMGHKIFKLEPIHGFASEISSAIVINTASLFGAPISTTHVITSSVFGVGSTKRFSAVRWGIAGNMVFAWVVTLPASALVAALFMWVFGMI